MSEWQPIETAPKDGTNILAMLHNNDDLSPQIITWVNGDWVFALDLENIHKAWLDWPTHWMPLPKPPVALTRNQGE